MYMLFAILQKYEFSSKSQQGGSHQSGNDGCLRYCKSTSFQANHNYCCWCIYSRRVVCDTAKVRVFKQITTLIENIKVNVLLFAILQKYEFSSKSQPIGLIYNRQKSCLRYCKSTSFQANHNMCSFLSSMNQVVCDTAKVRVFKQITT